LDILESVTWDFVVCFINQATTILKEVAGATRTALGSTKGPNIKGNILGVDIELTPSVSFELGQENNNTIDAKSYGKLTVKLPLVCRAKAGFKKSPSG
jgi:hypothetical protein